MHENNTAISTWNLDPERGFYLGCVRSDIEPGNDPDFDADQEFRQNLAEGYLTLTRSREYSDVPEDTAVQLVGFRAIAQSIAAADTVRRISIFTITCHECDEREKMADKIVPAVQEATVAIGQGEHRIAARAIMRLYTRKLLLQPVVKRDIYHDLRKTALDSGQPIEV